MSEFTKLHDAYMRSAEITELRKDRLITKMLPIVNALGWDRVEITEIQSGCRQVDIEWGRDNHKRIEIPRDVLAATDPIAAAKQHRHDEIVRRQERDRLNKLAEIERLQREVAKL